MSEHPILAAVVVGVIAIGVLAFVFWAFTPFGVRLGIAVGVLADLVALGCERRSTRLYRW